jgi:hypothetical protein
MRGCLHVTQRNRPQKKLLTQSPSIRSAAFSYHCPRTLVAHPSRASPCPFFSGGESRGEARAIPLSLHNGQRLLIQQMKMCGVVQKQGPLPNGFVVLATRSWVLRVLWGQADSAHYRRR